MRAADGRFLKGSHWRPAAPHWGAVWLREQYEGLELADAIALVKQAALKPTKEEGDTDE